MANPDAEKDVNNGHTVPVGQSARITRRGLLQVVGVSSATAALAMGSPRLGSHLTMASSQINSTPPTTSALPPSPDPIADLAAKLNYEVEAIFAFVRDAIQYESYTGVLRGAIGTLWARAGNSADQAMLLADLLAASQIPHRFVIGDLGTDQVETLTSLITPEKNRLVSNYTDAIIASFTASIGSVASDQASSIPDVGLSNEDQLFLNELSSNADKAIIRAQSLLESQVTIIEEALLNSGVTLPDSMFSELPDFEIHRHMWLQIPDGPNWIDYAPALGDQQPGSAPGDIVESFTDVPADLFHNLTISIIAEEYFSGATVRREAVSVTTTSSNIVNEPILFAVVPLAMFTGTGLAVNQIVSGEVSLLPVLTGKGQIFSATTPVVFGAEGGLVNALDDVSPNERLADGETIGLWLTVDVQSPGAEAVIIERPILDRLGFDNRAASRLDFSRLQPVSVIDAFEYGSTIPELMSAHVLHVEGTRLPISYSLESQLDDDGASVPSILTSCMSAFRDALRIREELITGATSYIASPQISLTTVSLVNPLDPETGAILTVDLLRHETAAIPLEGNTSSNSSILLRAGVLDYVAEHLTVNPIGLDELDGLERKFLPDTGTILLAAREQEIPIIAVAAIEDIDAIQASPEALSRIRKSLAEGNIVVVPNRQVTMGSALLTGWWVVDAKSGRTWDETQEGRGFGSIRLKSPAARFGPLIEETKEEEAAAKMQPFYRRMGSHLDCGYAIAAIALGVGGGVFAAATANSLAGAGAAVAITKGIRDANKKFGSGGCR